ncbi:membrane-bound lytic murein transglycosylase MltC [Pseudodesulfovibrio sp. F-1]|uniref:Membrane-bound lytic murein transglycosylase MltC n=1 Tax=Pseudodesulfovibrio alkaliphilus TaxID=2661613 RepID=A0A7K1KLV5_9BACT|nr:membrane-bound lytic murein transglycosylase MltC [Pseudodesulfovibrio alkaliphilus]MUM76941.1 membrane-bound lytic murein transglycosylase MltC [Pseudodesulfovibrio alkaliphilus]
MKDRALALVVLITMAALLGSCSRHDAVRVARAAATGSPAAAAESLARSKAQAYAANPAALTADLKQMARMIESFLKAVESVWGKKDTRVPTPKEYVKYTHNYLSRASVDFDKGIILVETLDQENPMESLRTAIITTLLTPADPRTVDLYSSSPVKLGETPFLYGEVKDHEGHDIRWAWRAERFADHLMASGVGVRTIDGKTVRAVTFHMIPDHLDVRARKYRGLVETAAVRFAVSRSLIYAIMKVESDFNPFAVSHANAIGLMQVVAATAGSDVYRLLNGREGQPGQDDLFHPPTNITYGTAYLHLLDTRYLSGVADPVSREYCVIAGYNGGAGGVLRTFHSDRAKAARRINGMHPGAVYDTLRTSLPHAETRRYLGKVVDARRHFVNF